MKIHYKYNVDEQGKVGNLEFAEPNFIAGDGWKVGDCINDVLPDIETLHEQKYLDAQVLVQYKIDRQSAYPSVGDQLDMMMKDKRDGTTTHQTACEAVKTQFPKG